MAFAYIIYGPTAVGKSDFAHMLAERIGGEIINADAAQLYTPLTIGTAKPDWKQGSVPYHMYDVCSQPTHHSVARYRAEAERLVSEITARGKIPIFVGGSGFYIHSLFFPVATHQKNERSVAAPEISWESLHAIDPVRAAAIHPHDTYRITRALALYQQTGELPSALQPPYCPITQLFLVELTMPTELLKERMQARVSQMLERDWIGETRTLLNTPWEPFVLQKKWIGYPELISYCKAGELVHTLPQVTDLIIRNTWRYARRQLAYGRMLMHKIQLANQNAVSMKIDLTSHDLALYIKKLLDYKALLQKGLSNE